jgi:LysM repeat protein
MSQTYTVKSGDTLLQIAIDHDVEFTDLLELNPKYQPNPNLIHIGDVLTLPEKVDFESIEPKYDIEPVSDVRPASCQGSIMSAPQCASVEYEDIVFFTGASPDQYLCLDAKSHELMEQESAQTDALISRYREIMSSAPEGKHATEAAIAEHALKRQAWVEDAIYAGAIAPEQAKRKVAGSGSSSTAVDNKSDNEKKRNSQIAELEQRIKFVKNYDASWFIDERSVEDVRGQLLAPLEKELAELKALNPQKNNTQKPKTWPVKAKQFSQKTKELVTKPATRHIIEVWSVRNNRYLYLRAEFVERERKIWASGTKHTALNQALKSGKPADIIKAIKEDIQGDPKKKISSTLKINFAKWTADGGVWKEWAGQKYWLNGDGDALFAVGAEAQLMRWGAQAAVDTTFEPTEGKVDIGISAKAQFSLAEASIKFSEYLPHEKGYGLSLTYLDANKEVANYSFGRIRAMFEASLGAFVGIRGEAGAKAEVNLTKKSKESKATGTGIMLSPKVSMSSGAKAGGNIGVKAEGFAGAEAGGELKGSIDWCDPKDEATLKFGSLGTLGGKSTIAFGAGAGVDFMYGLQGGKFYLHCSSRLVWGAGASGGFASEVDLNKVWDMAQVIWRGLQYVDYRFLANIDERLYKYLIHSSYLAFASDLIDDPHMALKNAVTKGENAVFAWWRTRESRKKEAQILAYRLTSKQFDVWSGVPRDQLLPETIGMMLDTLVEEFLLQPTELQERAICLLLKESTYSWHKFEEILARMNPSGKKESGEKVIFTNLDRINEILVFDQQQEFNTWVHQLAEKQFLSSREIALNQPFTERVGYAFSQKINELNTTMLAKQGGQGTNRIV